MPVLAISVPSATHPARVRERRRAKIRTRRAPFHGARGRPRVRNGASDCVRFNRRGSRGASGRHPKRHFGPAIADSTIREPFHNLERGLLTSIWGTCVWSRRHWHPSFGPNTRPVPAYSTFFVTPGRNDRAFSRSSLSRPRCTLNPETLRQQRLELVQRPDGGGVTERRLGVVVDFKE